jgi:CubicO group peptidase (beta-lactamase class C family)
MINAHFAPDQADSICRATIAAQGIPGLSIAIAHGGKTLLAQGYGYRNVADRVACDADTIYSIASVSKQFTAAAIMRLHEQGMLSIEDPLHKYFPWVPCGSDVTLTHLLSHTSGIPGYTEVPDFECVCYSEGTFREIVMLGADRPAAFAPGERWEYSNTNYVLLGGIIENVSQQSYAQFLCASFFEPLEMSSSGVDDVWSIRQNYAVGYTSYSLGPLERAREWHPSWEFATGGLFSTAPDLLRWNNALRTGNVVSPASYAVMSHARTLTDGSSTKYGFGLFREDVRGLTEVRHTGGLPGFSSDNATYPDVGMDIVILANRDAAGTYFSATRKILSRTLGRESLAVWQPPPLDKGVAPPPDPVTWIDAARADALDELPLTEAFQRFLHPRRRAALRSLGQHGAVKRCDLLEAYRRNPVNIYTYKVRFDRKIVSALLITMMDTGAIEMIAFYPWDHRDLISDTDIAQAAW